MGKGVTTVSWMRNILAVIGALAIVAVIAWLALDFIGSHGLCQKAVGNTASVRDAKASVYQFDCGAMAATRRYVMLSNPSADGWKGGDGVVTLLKIHDPSDVLLEWKTNRHLRVAYPASAEVEFAVAKTRGITIELAAVAWAPNEAKR